jgi:tetratricopeptide (TPR) repeat protein
LQDQARAIELARQARNLAPEDPQVAHTLGRMAFQAGNTAWALSLLEQSTRQRPTPPEVQYDLARVYYAVGRLRDAQKSLQTALQTPNRFSQAGAAQKLLTMIGWNLDPAAAATAAASGQVELVLRENPKDVPALFASGLVHQQKGEGAAARQQYEVILQQQGYENFIPARKQLAMVLVEHLRDYEAAYPHAAKAREALPNDPVVAKVLGIVTYHRKEFPHAAQLLEQSARSLDKDGSVFFHLGVVQVQLDRKPAAIRSLEKALELEPDAAFAEKAKQTLAELQSD